MLGDDLNRHLLYIASDNTCYERWIHAILTHRSRIVRYRLKVDAVY